MREQCHRKESDGCQCGRAQVNEHAYTNWHVQKINFNAAVIFRGPFTELVMTPKLGLVVPLFATVKPGVLKLTRFMALYASIRNWRIVFSLTGVLNENSLKADKSTCWYPGPDP